MTVSVREVRGLGFCIPLMLGLLAGCASDGVYAPVSSAGEVSRASRGSLYVVQHGDTLYSIAFRYGLDYKALAAANDIRAPYTIYVDQRLRIPRGDTGDVVRDAAPAPSERPVSVVKKRQEPAIDTPRVTDSEIDWRWPHGGEVVGEFSLSGKVNKGIDILGKSGESVRCSADGVVVYAGGGLRGYGKLVIVKHNDRYLSAYGHNQKILVKEGDKVKRGQVVARIGGNNGNPDLMHFEIRRNGKPEDPLRYLPPRT